MKKNPFIFLHHALDCIEYIQLYIKGMSFEEFEKNIEKQDSVLRRFEIIGEAVRHLPDDFRRRYSKDDTNWKKIVGMRDEIIHHYFGVDLKIVWDTIRDDLPIFKVAVQSILKDEKDDGVVE